MDCVKLKLPDGPPLFPDYHTSETYSTITSISSSELDIWRAAYKLNPLLSCVLSEKEDKYSQYQVQTNGLIYFEDWNRNHRLVVLESLQVDVMSEVHNTITEAAHGGYTKTYNCIAAAYYWPRMSQDIKKYVGTCNICQKAKPRRHAPLGLLQPIPIPSQPFEVVSMDFIPELLEFEGHNSILVIVDKLTKYAIFVLMTTTMTKKALQNSSFIMLFPNMVSPDRAFLTEIFNGRGNSGRKYVKKWE